MSSSISGPMSGLRSRSCSTRNSNSSWLFFLSRPNTAVSGFPARGFAACASSVILFSYLSEGLLM